MLKTNDALALTHHGIARGCNVGRLRLAGAPSAKALTPAFFNELLGDFVFDTYEEATDLHDRMTLELEALSVSALEAAHTARRWAGLIEPDERSYIEGRADEDGDPLPVEALSDGSREAETLLRFLRVQLTARRTAAIIEQLRPFYWECARGRSVLDWAAPATRDNWKAIWQMWLNESPSHASWWEQSGLKFRDLLPGVAKAK